ncbi:hypothetical protein Salat_2742600 [Sesamum alatum]|uniref:Uncharacterized protein n=1 Tax=Sesamum alatum TaxID=300844 RepID=A0AAE2C939_9LAMI|nr:hypothetical protein Salat_2742600 [Sesamum alatum]
MRWIPKGPKTPATTTRLLWPNRHTGFIHNKTSRRALSTKDFTKTQSIKDYKVITKAVHKELNQREHKEKKKGEKGILSLSWRNTHGGVFIEKKKKSLDEGINSGDIGKRG